MKILENEERPWILESYYSDVEALLADPYTHKMLNRHDREKSELKLKGLRKSGKPKKLRRSKC